MLPLGLYRRKKILYLDSGILGEGFPSFSLLPMGCLLGLLLPVGLLWFLPNCFLPNSCWSNTRTTLLFAPHTFINWRKPGEEKTVTKTWYGKKNYYEKLGRKKTVTKTWGGKKLLRKPGEKKKLLRKPGMGKSVRKIGTKKNKC